MMTTEFPNSDGCITYSHIAPGTIPKDRIEGYDDALKKLDALESTVCVLTDLLKGLVNTFNLQAQTVDILCRAVRADHYEAAYKKLASLNIHTDQEIRKILSKDFGEN